MLAADIRVSQQARFFNGQLQHLLGAGRKRNIAKRQDIGSRGKIALNLVSELIDIEPHLLEHGNRNTLILPQNGEQKVLRAKIIVARFSASSLAYMMIFRPFSVNFSNMFSLLLPLLHRILILLAPAGACQRDSQHVSLFSND